MRLSFKIENYKKVYDVLVNKFGFEKDIFLTDDVIEVDKESLAEIKEALPDVCFKKIR